MPSSTQQLLHIEGIQGADDKDLPRLHGFCVGLCVDSLRFILYHTTMTMAAGTRRHFITKVD